jgi:hypothetical protein
MWRRTPYRANGRCPLCDRPVVVEPTHAVIGRKIMFAPRTREESVAACSIHGRPSFNDKTRAVGSGSS